MSTTDTPSTSPSTNTPPSRPEAATNTPSFPTGPSTNTPSSRPEALSEAQPSRTGRSGETPVFASQTDDAQQIRDLVATWCRATEACDIEAIKPLMDDDILFFTTGHEPFGADVFVQRFLGNVQQLCPSVSADVRELEIRGDLAFARTWLEVRITPPGSEPIKRTGYTLAVYRRRPGGPWKLWRDANLV